MRLALLSDVHANHPAFARAVALSERAGAEGFVLMGDYVCDFAHPRKTFDLVAELRRRYPTWLIRGNRDEYLLDHRAGKSPDWRDGTAGGSLLYTYENLREEDFALLESLPSCLEVRMDGHPPFAVCHGSPFRAREMMIEDDGRIGECLKVVSTDRLFLGHTHRVRRFRADGKEAHFCGSIGLPDGFGGMTQFALLDDRTGAWEIEHVMAEYDVEAAVAEIEASGLAARAGLWARAVAVMARTGKNAPDLLVRTARELAGGWKGPIPESCFVEAARRIGILP